MAHIYQGTLSNVDFDRQHDVYQLARWGDSKCKSLWADFAKSSPDLARLVVTYDEQQKRTKDNAAAIVDTVITKAYGAKKSKKLSKGAKSAFKKAKKNPYPTVEQQVMRMFGNSPDPVTREAARKIAGM